MFAKFIKNLLLAKPGVVNGVFYQFYNNRSLPIPDTFVKIIKFLDVDVRELILNTKNIGMSYKSHPLIEEPSDPNTKIWRYMDIFKFINLMISSSLYFALPSQFDDPFEGSYPGKSKKVRKDYWDAIKTEYPQYKPFLEFVLEHDEKKRKKFRDKVGINCWHMNTNESAAMWKLYLKSDEGIAIQSTLNRLKNSLNVAKENIWIGKVQYMDYDIESIDTNLAYANFLCKRRSFEHEKEIRAIINLSQIHGQNTDLNKGESIKVDLITLIENVYISPNSPTFIRNDLEQVVNKLGYNFSVKQSDMNKDPIF